MANPKTQEQPPAPPAPPGPEFSQTEPPEPPEPPAAAKPVALVIENADGMLCRPPIGVGIATLGPVVIGNWFGHIDGKSVTVEHGTPLRGLPAAVVKRVRETPGQRCGLYDPRKPAGTQATAG